MFPGSVRSLSTMKSTTFPTYLKTRTDFISSRSNRNLKKGPLPLDIVKDRIVQALSDFIKLEKAGKYFDEVLKKNP